MIDPTAEPAGKSSNKHDILRERLATARQRVSAAPQIPRVEHNGPRQTSLGQQRLYYLYELFPNSHAYHLQVQCELNGVLDVQRLENAVRSVIRHHEVLHSVMQYTNGRLTSEPQSDLSLNLPFHDLTELADAECDEFIMNSTAADGNQRFNLQTELPLRATLFQRSAQQHIFLLTFHHIAVDERSLEVILGNISRCYNEKSSVALAADEVTYADFALWSSENETGKSSSIDYWTNHLAGAPSDVALSGDVTTATSEAGCGRQASAEVSQQTSDALLRLSQTHNVTPFITQLAAFAVLLHRYSGARCIVIGTPASNRNRPELKDVVGFFVETLPIRIDFDDGMTFDQLILQIRNRLTEAIDHIEAPFEEIVKAVNPAQQNGRNPVFNVMFAAQRPLEQTRIVEDLHLTPRIIDSGAAKFDLTMFAGNLKADRNICIEYNTSLFTPHYAERMLTHWNVLLHSIANNSKTHISDLKLTTAPEALRQKALCGDPIRNSASDCVHDIIKQKADAKPYSIAVQFDGESLTYEDLNRRAHRLSTQLKFSPGSAIAICYERSADMIVGILAVLKAGCAYVPIATDLPKARRHQILESSSVSAVLTQDKLRPQFEDQTLTVFVERTDEGEEVTAPSQTVKIGHNDLCYVIHTSGSTGLPKGVEVTHGALLQSTLARTQFYAETPDRFLLLSPIWFDSSVAGIFWTLCAGGTLVIPPEGRLQNIRQLADDIAQHSVTHMLCLPSVYQILLRHAEASQLNSLQSVIVAGESCHSSVANDHFQLQPLTKLFNEYGPTEASVWATACRIENDDNRKGISIGKAVPGIQLHLLNASQQPVPTGVDGELYIGGTRLARGYRNVPELTNEKFIERSGQRIYRTGDMARQETDGNLTFLGRSDDQMKINGHRIEPAEIEEALRSCSGVDEVLVALAAVETSQAPTTAYLMAQLESLSTAEAETLLAQSEAFTTVSPDERNPNGNATIQTAEVSINVDFHQDNFIATPRNRQRKWLINQQLAESLSDLQHLDRVAPQMIAGSDEPHVPRDLSEDRMTDQEIMEDWQTPLMKSMADYGCCTHGDVLEIGFGRGVAATFIQQAGVRSHTIVEMNSFSISDFFLHWQKQFQDQDIRMIEGRWQDVTDQLQTYDTVFFHAFPMNEAEFVEHIVNSVTFAEHFFSTAAALLRPGGAFVYMTTEIDSVSRRHQRSLFQHFDEVQMKVEALDIPKDTKDAWWANSMVVLKAIRRADATGGDHDV